MNMAFIDNYYDNDLKDIELSNVTQTLRMLQDEDENIIFMILGESNPINTKSTSFMIEASDPVYPLFNRLYNNIINCNIFDNTEDLALCTSEEEMMETLCSSTSNDTNLKNKESYIKLVNNNTIMVESEGLSKKKGNSLIIRKDNDHLLFTLLLSEDDPTLEVKIKSEDSRYAPFNMCFMDLYKELQVLYNIRLQRTLKKDNE